MRTVKGYFWSRVEGSEAKTGQKSAIGFNLAIARHSCYSHRMSAPPSPQHVRRDLSVDLFVATTLHRSRGETHCVVELTSGFVSGIPNLDYRHQPHGGPFAPHSRYTIRISDLQADAGGLCAWTTYSNGQVKLSTKTDINDNSCTCKSQSRQVNHSITNYISQSSNSNLQWTIMGSIGTPSFAAENAHLDHDVIIIGAGLSGIYSLYRMRQLGLRAKVLEAGSGEGGTWFW